jgi:chromosome segregation ATPase
MTELEMPRLAEGVEFLEGTYGDYDPVRVVLDTLEQARFDLKTFRLANEGHVRMIADLAAERDELKVSRAEARGIVFDLDEELGNAKAHIYSISEELRVTKSELYAMKRERDKMRSERDKLLYDSPPRQA